MASKLIALSQTTESQATFSAFAEQLFTLLGPVFATRPNKSLKIQRGQMWGAYHLLRTSPTFIQRWSSFMSSTLGDVSQDPILIQYVTDEFFHRLISCQYSLADQQVVPPQQQALHYAAGAVCCTLKKQIEKSNHPSKGDLLIGIDDLCYDDDQGFGYAKEWEQLIDRGGLCHVKDETYQLFYVMELLVRQHLTIQGVGKLTSGSRPEIKKSVLKDEEVLFAWEIPYFQKVLREKK